MLIRTLFSSSFIQLHNFLLSLLMFSKVFGKFLVSFWLSKILEISDLAMAKDKKANIADTTRCPTWVGSSLPHTYYLFHNLWKKGFVTFCWTGIFILNFKLAIFSWFLSLQFQPMEVSLWCHDILSTVISSSAILSNDTWCMQLHQTGSDVFKLFYARNLPMFVIS